MVSCIISGGVLALPKEAFNVINIIKLSTREGPAAAATAAGGSVKVR